MILLQAKGSGIGTALGGGTSSSTVARRICAIFRKSSKFKSTPQGIDGHLSIIPPVNPSRGAVAPAAAL